MPGDPALPLVFRYASPTLGLVLEVVSLRRPDLVLRVTRYPSVVVDEGLLTRSFPPASSDGRVAFAVIEGTIRVAGAEPATIGPGGGVATPVDALGALRLSRTTTLELALVGRDGDAPAPLRPFDVARARAIADALRGARDQRAVFADAFDFFERAGYPVAASARALAGSPSERDARLGRALEEQIANLSSQATTRHLGDAVGLSPRQLQRVVREWNARYGFNAGNWRDTRNRWRVQIAAIMLSSPDVAVETLAREVGYASAGALARAMANVGMPAPAEVRRALGG